MKIKVLGVATVLTFALVLASCGGGGGGGGDAAAPANQPGGKNSAVYAIRNSAPASSCPNGGISVDAGIDTNGNGALDASEATSTQYVCNGETGAVGANGVNGLNSLVSVVTEQAGTNCANGGSKVYSGLDSNANGVLDTAEVSSPSYVCGSPPAPSEPKAPANVQAIGGDSQTTISWTPEPGAYSYNIYWNTAGDVTASDNRILNASMPYVHSGRTNNVVYYYRITAVNSAGESALSAEASSQPGQPFGSAMQRISAGDAEAIARFGYSVSVSGDYAIVGAPYKDNDTGTLADAGAAYIFHRTGANTWDSGTRITAPDPEASARFGGSVSISGDYAVVGANAKDEGGPADAGVAYVFHRTGINTWDGGIKITSPEPEAIASFGDSVSISGDYAIVGASRKDGVILVDAGAAYIFHRTGANAWDSGTGIKALDPEASAFFGLSVSISGDYAIVGAPNKDDDTGMLADAGAAYIFHRTGTNTWDSGTRFTDPDIQAGSRFGGSVAIKGDYAIVGAPYKDNDTGTLGDAGVAYVFHRTGTNTWDNWTAITEPILQPGAHFGCSVSISGDYAIVGAYGAFLQQGGTREGGAYIFHRTGPNAWAGWSNITGPAAGGFFGGSVSLSGDYAIVGAYTEVEGGLAAAGAAYLY